MQNVNGGNSKVVRGWRTPYCDCTRAAIGDIIEDLQGYRYRVFEIVKNRGRGSHFTLIGRCKRCGSDYMVKSPRVFKSIVRTCESCRGRVGHHGKAKR